MAVFVNRRGQSLVEFLIAVGIGAVVLLTAIGMMRFMIRLSAHDPVAQIATFFAQDMVSAVTVMAEGSWSSIADATAGTKYQVSASTDGFIRAANEETKIINGISYTRHFTVSGVSRDSNDLISGDAGSADDPSTKKITVVVSWLYQGAPYATAVEQYVARTRNETVWQTDWVGGPTCPTDDSAVRGVNFRFCATTSGIVDYTSEPGSIKIQGY